MSGLTFSRPVGAAADIKELEYIIALQQTSAETRRNATVSSLDILALLKSRYSLTITHEQAIEAVRSLGGGDTLCDKPRSGSQTSLSQMTQNSKDYLAHLWNRAADTWTNPLQYLPTFHSGELEEGQDEDAEEEEKPQPNFHGELPTPMRRKQSLAQSRGGPPRDRLAQLQKLHSMQQIGGIDNRQFVALHDEIQASLRAHVVAKAEAAAVASSTRNLGSSEADGGAEPLNSDAKRRPVAPKKNLSTVTEGTPEEESSKSSLRPTLSNLRADSQGIAMFANADFIPTEEFQVESNLTAASTADSSGEEAASAAVKKSVSFTAEAEEEEIEFVKDDEEDGPPLAEYLDLMQILTTLLIPSFARYAHYAKLRKAAGKTDDDDDDEEEEAPVPETPPPRLPLYTRLLNRFIRYGRRKLGIRDYDEEDANANPFTAKQVMQLAMTSLLKTIPPEASLVDESLVQLLLLQHGEIERANNPELIAEMVAVAQSDSGLFDQQALLNALASDLEPWDPTCEAEPTTFFYDVFGEAMPSSKTQLRPKEDNEQDDKDKVEITRVEEAVAPPPRAQSLPKEQSSAAGAPPERSLQREASKDANPSVYTAAQKEHDLSDDDDVTVSLLGRCTQCLFPMWHAMRRGKASDFSTLFLGIDLVIDANSSIFVHVLILVSYFLSVTVYGTLIIRAPNVERDCEFGDYWCTISGTVYAWAVVAVLLIGYGIYFVVPLSVGNNPADKSVARQFFSFAYAIVNALWPFIFVNWLADNPKYVENDAVEVLIRSDEFQYAQNVTLAFGMALAFIFLGQCIVMLCFRNDHPQKLRQPFQFFFSAAHWNGETRVYKAAKLKIEKLVSNALSLHESSREMNLSRHDAALPRSHKMALAGARDLTMRNYILNGETREQVGGIVWVWWKFFDGSLFDREGLWINTRLLVIQMAQIAIGIFVTAILYIFANDSATAADDWRDTLSGLPDWVMDIFPTGTMIRASLLPATLVSAFVMFLIGIIYVPSSMATVLKYRAKILPSLGSPYFQKYRSNVDLAYMNTANAIYAMLGCALLYYIAVGLFIFLFVWPITRDLMYMALAWGVGLGITIGIKMIVTMGCRKIQYRSYYRIKPAAARITTLALECWHIGLAGSVLIARITQFLVASLFWVGRIDVPYLSDDVCLFGYTFDYVPTHYWKGLLIHEAHRHPYIERLAQMYLMKLRYGDKFVSRAGSAWRQLLVLSVFPWVARYRVFSDERRLSAEIEAEENEKQKEREADPYLGARTMKNEVVGVGQNVGEEVYDAGAELYGAGEDIVDEFGRAGKAVLGPVSDVVGKGATAALRGSVRTGAFMMGTGLSPQGRGRRGTATATTTPMDEPSFPYQV